MPIAHAVPLSGVSALNTRRSPVGEASPRSDIPRARHPLAVTRGPAATPNRWLTTTGRQGHFPLTTTHTMTTNIQGGQNRTPDDLQSDASAIAIGLVVLALLAFWLLVAWVTA